MRDEKLVLYESETADTALGGDVGIIQPKKGYRFSLDAVLLARYASGFIKAGKILDIGCGSGVAGLSMLRLNEHLTLTGIDIQAEAIDRARRSAAWNGFEERTRFLEADVTQLNSFETKYDGVISNPPFRPLSTGKVSPNRAIALSKHELALTVEGVAKAASFLLKDKGLFCLVFPAKDLERVVKAVRKVGIEPNNYRLIIPRAAENPTLFLLAGIKGEAEGELIEEPPLILHPDHSSGRKYTEEAERLLGRV